MSEDVRKHLRTQGRYSDKGHHSDDKGHKSRDKRQKVSPAAKEPPEKKFHKRNSGGNKGVNMSSTDESVSPLKYEENSEYTFSQLDEIKKPIEIMGRGKHILSNTDNGESTVFYEPDFLHEDEAYEYFDRLYNNTNWHEKNIVIQGVEYPQPRLVAWFGPYPYSYSGATLEPTEMPDTVVEVKEKVERYLAESGIEATFNSVLLNMYRDGGDSVSWHCDNELTMGISPTIASVSLGETRRFEMRYKMKRYEDESPTDQMDKYFVHLTHGSLLIMTGCMQDDWQHRVPKEYHDKETRINLTFRTVYPLEKIPEHVPAKEVKKEPIVNYSSNKTSSCVEINFDVVNFPPLKSDISLACSNVKYKKDDNISNGNWDSETSDDEQNVRNGVIDNVHTYESTCATNNKRDCIIENKNSLSSVESNIKVSVDSPVNVTQENNLDKKEFPRKWHHVEANDNEESNEKEFPRIWRHVEANDNQANNKKEFPRKWRHVETNDNQEKNLDKKEFSRKWRHVEANSSVNDSQENNFGKKEPPKKFRNGKASSSVNGARENNMNKKESPEIWRTVEANSRVNDDRENNFGKKEHPKVWRNVEANSHVNENRENSSFGKKDPSKKFHNGETNSIINELVRRESNMDKNECPMKCHNIEVNSPVNATQENNLDKKEPPKTWHCVETNSPTNITQKNNLDKQEPIKTWLNVEAKEFVPGNIVSYETNHYNQFDLEDLIHYEIAFMQGEQLQDLAYTLRDKVLERLYDFRRFDREELEFLCSLTDGSQTDKNQKLISARICNIVINALERSQTSSNVRRSFDGNSRQRGYGNQSHYSDRGRRFQNQGRSNNHRY